MAAFIPSDRPRLTEFHVFDDARIIADVASENSVAVLFVVVIAAFRSLGVSESVGAAAGIGIFLLALFQR